MLNLTDRHGARWINSREKAGASFKTIANWHGLLFQIKQCAVEERRRVKNSCATTGRSLPKRGAYRTEEDKVFLAESEFALIADALWPGLPDPNRGGRVVAVGRPEDRDLVVVAVGIGARQGELTALQVSDCQLTKHPRLVDVQRTWKKNGTGEFARAGVGSRYLGVPRPRSADAKSGSA